MLKRLRNLGNRVKLVESIVVLPIQFIVNKPSWFIGN